MIRPRLVPRAALALGLAALMAPAASAQTHFLAVSEVSGGANGLGEVAIYQQNDTTGALYNGSTIPYATITAQSHLANPMGLAFDSLNSTLYIAGLGNNGIVSFNVNTHAINTYAVSGGYYNLNGMAISGSRLFVSAYDGGTAASPGAVLQYNLAADGSLSGPVYIDKAAGLVGPTGLTTLGSDAYVNSSQTGQLYLLNGPQVLLVPLVPYATSAPAGLAQDNNGGLIYETNFFKTAAGGVGVSTYEYQQGAYYSQALPDSSNYKHPSLGGPADIVFGPATNQLFVSDFGDNLIYQYTADGTGFFGNPSQYLTNISTPTYLAEFSTAAAPSFTGAFTVPEPSSVALLALGGPAILLARRRLVRPRTAARDASRE